MNPDEALAKGAAVLAAQLAGADHKTKVILHDATPLSVRILVNEGQFKPMISHGTRIPTSFTDQFSTYFNSQTTVSIYVFEGEQPMAEDNNPLGKSKIEGVRPAPRGTEVFDVTFCIDREGVTFSALYKKGDVRIENAVKVEGRFGTVSLEEKQRMIEASFMLKEVDREEDERVAA